MLSLRSLEPLEMPINKRNDSAIQVAKVKALTFISVIELTFDESKIIGTAAGFEMLETLRLLSGR